MQISKSEKIIASGVWRESIVVDKSILIAYSGDVRADLRISTLQE